MTANADVAARRAVYEPLADSVRRLIDITIRTEADAAVVAAARRKINSGAAELSTALMSGSFGTRRSEDGQGIAWGNVLIGVRNPVAPPLVIQHDGDGRVCTEFTLGAARPSSRGPHTRRGSAGRGRLRVQPRASAAIRRTQKHSRHDGSPRQYRAGSGIAAGGAIDLMDQAWWSPGLTHPDGRSAFALWFTGGIFVNSDGNRFVNESAPYDHIGRTVIDQMSSHAMTLPFWLVYDDREGPLPPVKAPNVSLVEAEKFVAAGLWHTADTLPRLAAKIGVDGDFGRGYEAYDRAFSGGLSPMVPIETGPYHAAAFGLSDLGTKGGLVTDTHARVLDDQGRPIAGLYAAGNTMASVSGTAYPAGGTPIGASMLFSHLAAEHMAAGTAR